MLASQMIVALQDIIDKYGDLPVLAEHDALHLNDTTFDPKLEVAERFLPRAELAVIPEDKAGLRTWRERVKKALDADCKDYEEHSGGNTIYEDFKDDVQALRDFALQACEDDMRTVIVVRVEKPLAINGVSIREWCDEWELA